jgi:LmbE family N-acetylglucosaminyl deacetylase
MVLCAHSDDQILGPGGTLAKYANEGKDIVIIVFSFGEKTHPWLKKKHTIEMRVKESQEAAKVIGAKETMFFGLEEGKFAKQIEERDISEKTATLIKKYKPSKIFVHSMDDPHPDHRNVNKFVLGLCDEINYKGDVYVFDIWNPVNFKKGGHLKLVVDTTKTFKTKIKALKCFKSQWLARALLLWSVYFKALKNGFQNNCRYAEVFYKVR